MEISGSGCFFADFPKPRLPAPRPLAGSSSRLQNVSELCGEMLRGQGEKSPGVMTTRKARIRDLTGAEEGYELQARARGDVRRPEGADTNPAARRASVSPHLAAPGPRLPGRQSRLWVSLVTGQLIRAVWCLSAAVSGGEAAGYMTPVHAHPRLWSYLGAHACTPT